MRVSVLQPLDDFKINIELTVRCKTGLAIAEAIWKNFLYSP
jgi:hypothetical protein